MFTEDLIRFYNVDLQLWVILIKPVQTPGKETSFRIGLR